MKNTMIRAFVAALVLTGTFATAHATKTGAPVVNATHGIVPIPLCPPDDPDGCGIGGGKKQK